MANYSMTLKGPLKNRSVIFLTTQKTWNYKLFMVVEHLMLAIHWLVSVLQAWWHFFFFNLKWFTLNLKHFYKNLCMQESHPLLKLHEVPTTDSSQVRQVRVHRGSAACPRLLVMEDDEDEKTVFLKCAAVIVVILFGCFSNTFTNFGDL